MKKVNKIRKALNNLEEKFGEGFCVFDLPVIVNKLFAVVSEIEKELEKLKRKK